MSLAVIALSPLGQAFSESEVQALSAARTWLYNQTKNLSGSGFFVGTDEAASHEVFFPIGVGDRLYYLSYDMGDLSFKSKPKCAMTCWSKVGNKAHRDWQIWFKPLDSSPWKAYVAKDVKVETHRGTLAQLAYYKGGSGSVGFGTRREIKFWAWKFVPDSKSSGWEAGKRNLEIVQTLVNYHFGTHGDIELGSLIWLDGPTSEGRSKSIEYLPLDGHLPVPGAEVREINRRRAFG